MEIIYSACKKHHPLSFSKEDLEKGFESLKRAGIIKEKETPFGRLRYIQHPLFGEIDENQIKAWFQEKGD